MLIRLQWALERHHPVEPLFAVGVHCTFTPSLLDAHDHACSRRNINSTACFWVPAWASCIDLDLHLAGGSSAFRNVLLSVVSRLRRIPLQCVRLHSTDAVNAFMPERGLFVCDHGTLHRIGRSPCSYQEPPLAPGYFKLSTKGQYFAREISS
jgi:hypothetical protein